MTDLEITRLCAQALDCEIDGDVFWFGAVQFNPLHSNAHTMALIKSLKICISYGAFQDTWAAWRPQDTFSKIVMNKDLNRAVCEAVANAQAAK